MTSIEWPANSGRIYTAEPYEGRSCSDLLRLTAKPGSQTFVAIAGEIAAVRWLCDRSLKKSKAKLLVTQALEKDVLYPVLP